MNTRSNTKTALIAGTGFGGLAAGFHALAKGYRVVFVEAGDQPGGRARVFRKDGYTFDAGPTVITAPYLFAELFQLVGERVEEHVELVPVDPFYRILFDDGSQFDYVGDEEALLENIRRLSPADVDGYRNLCSHAQKIFEVGYTRLADEPFPSMKSMLRVLPDMVRLQSNRSVYALVSKYIKDPRLRQAFSFEPLLVGGNPFKVTSIYLLIHWLERKWGVHYAMGGTSSIVQAMCRVLASKGAEFHYNAPVEHIEVGAAGVESVHCRGGLRFSCDQLISNADPVKTYGEWIAPKWRPHHQDAKLKRKTQSMSLFVTYFGSRRKYDHLVHHTILLGSRYKGLLDDIFTNKQLADDFSLYLHAPTVTDPSMAPAGHDCFYVLSPVPNNASGIDWAEQQEPYQEKILAALERRLLPGLRDSLDVSFSITPDYFAQELHSTQGSAFGIEPLLSQSAYFRFHNRSEDIRGLYFVGANTHPGAGVPGVINSAKVLQKILPHSTQA